VKVEAVDTTKLEELIQGLKLGAQLERRRPDRVCDAVCYELLADYFRKAQRAKEEGKYLVGHTTSIPPEVFYAMDIVPLQLESVSTLASQIVRNFGDALSAASAFGLVPEVCSCHRLIAGQAILGWLPRPDAIVWSNQVCDNTSKSGNILVELYGCPGFFLERPYRYTERGVQYFAQELEELIYFLEELTGRKMDWGRFAEVMEHSRRLLELQREIRELRKAVPSPWRNLWFIHMMGTELYMAGTPEAITHFETVRDEVKKRAEKGEGYIHEERYRVLTMFVPPAYSWTLLGWMERKHGAVSVAEPHFSYRGGEEIDPTKPLESLARKSFYCPICRPMHGPAEEGILHDAVRDALEYKAEGAVYFAHIGCRQTDACIRMLKDALLEEAGIPTLILDVDLYDPTYASEDQLKDKLEGFFELVDERK
jgi:benzoyl-CoA reductase/2-hydroxyglutaryl-CoA dehydratase subunit BcrC/BadD/HgdB